MFGKASTTFACKNPCECKLFLLYHRSLNSNFAVKANDFFFSEEKEILILTPSNLSGSGEKKFHLSRTALSVLKFQLPLSGEDCKKIFIFSIPGCPLPMPLLLSLVFAVFTGLRYEAGGTRATPLLDVLLISLCCGLLAPERPCAAEDHGHERKVRI